MFEVKNGELFVRFTPVVTDDPFNITKGVFNFGPYLSLSKRHFANKRREPGRIAISQSTCRCWCSVRFSLPR